MEMTDKKRTKQYAEHMMQDWSDAVDDFVARWPEILDKGAHITFRIPNPNTWTYWFDYFNGLNKDSNYPPGKCISNPPEAFIKEIIDGRIE